MEYDTGGILQRRCCEIAQRVATSRCRKAEAEKRRKRTTRQGSVSAQPGDRVVVKWPDTRFVTRWPPTDQGGAVLGALLVADVQASLT